MEVQQITRWPRHNTKRETTNYKTYIENTKDRVTQTPLKTGGELKCFERESGPCSSSGTCRVNLVTNTVISHELGIRTH